MVKRYELYFKYCTLQFLSADAFVCVISVVAAMTYESVMLVIQNKKLDACRDCLIQASPILKDKIEGHGDNESIQLRGVQFDDMCELLLCITPNVVKEITGENVFRLLPLAHEYRIETILRQCEQFLLDGMAKRGRISNYLDLLLTAQKYELETLLQGCVKKMAACPVYVLNKLESSWGIQPRNVSLILAARVELLETMNLHWRRAAIRLQQQHADVQRSMERIRVNAENDSTCHCIILCKGYTLLHYTLYVIIHYISYN